MWSTACQVGLDGLADEPGRSQGLIAAAVRVITETARPLWQKPLEYSFDGTARWRFGEFGATHWSGNDIKPHRVKTFKLSNDRDLRNSGT